MKSHASTLAAVSLSLFTAPLLFSADAPTKPAAPAPASKMKLLGLTDPVAVVEGAEIRKADMEQAFNTVLASQGMPADQIDKLPDEQRLQFYHLLLDDMITDKLVTKRAAEEKVADEEIAAAVARVQKNFGSEEEMQRQLEASGQTIEKLKENVRRQLRAQHWIDAQVKGKDEVPDADADAFYKANPDKFKVPELVRASHILISTPVDAKPELVIEKQKAAQAILDRVKKGEDFATLAKDLSEDPSAKQNSGDLSFFPRDQMVKEFADAAFAMKKDEVSKEPVRSQFGYHIIKVTDRHEAETVTFEKAKPKVVAFLQRQKKEDAVKALVKELREKADVKVNLPALDAPAK